MAGLRKIMMITRTFFFGYMQCSREQIIYCLHYY